MCCMLMEVESMSRPQIEVDGLSADVSEAITVERGWIILRSRYSRLYGHINSVYNMK
jgi:hypothetical protein